MFCGGKRKSVKVKQGWQRQEAGAELGGLSELGEASVDIGATFQTLSDVATENLH